MSPHIDIELPTHRSARYRFFEILPGLLTWSILILPVALSFSHPWGVSIALLIYTLFWLFRSVRMAYRLLFGFRAYRQAIQVDWLKRCQDLPPERRWSAVTHVVIMAAYNESEQILGSSIAALANADYPGQRIIFVLALEERGGANDLAVANRLRERYQSSFRSFLITQHPKDIPGEVKGKGSNITFAGRTTLTYLRDQGIAEADTIVTTLDADNRVHPKYLAYLAYQFATDPDPLHHSYQPLPMFFNNIWDVPLPIRSISVGSSFWQLTESMRPERLRNFSAHAQSLAALVATDFWSVRTIVEDGHQYWRTFFRFHGRHTVIPLYVPIYQDAVLAPDGYIASFREQYLQKRRWAWGASDVAYVFTKLLDMPSIGFDGWVQGFRLLEGHISWAVTSLMLSVIAWAPITLSTAFRTSILAVNYPLIYTRILQVSILGLITTFMISLLMLPPLPKRDRRSWMSFLLEWVTAPILLPITNVLFGSFPSIEAQTRLMLGNYLDYRVTKKAVNRQDQAALVRRA